jgi:hypothetical protein
VDGADGAQGIQGIPGVDGADGAPGLPGADGADGADGASSTDANTLFIGSDNDADEASSTLTLGTDGAALVTILESGAVGVGMVPSYELDVNGTTRTKVLKITGGADLAEGFDVVAEPSMVKAGMVVSIDPANSGKLMVSATANDRRVAGIISGAGDVLPGMIMSQIGTAADGEHPVALTGRVYCWVDGAVEPGDLLTTSNVPGHAMAVKNYEKARGAIIGKALTAQRGGRGLVLVLVSLQ